MCKAIERVAGPQLLGVCCSNGGDAIEACAGKGAKVAVGVADGVSSITGADVAVAWMVAVGGCGVTGNAVGTGPTGSITFLA